MKKKRIILIILIFILSATIFYFSNQSGLKSITTSDNFTAKIIAKIENISKKQISSQRKKELIIKTRFIVRKFAHFTLYFILGILVYLIMTTYKINKKIFFSIIICLIFASMDEFHQLFSLGRTARIYDVLIDTLGSLTGLILTKIICTKKNNSC